MPDRTHHDKQHSVDGVRLPPTTESAPKYAVDIRRGGRKVVLTFTTETEYGAIALYDSLVDGAMKGRMTLQVNATPVKQDAKR